MKIENVEEWMDEVLERLTKIDKGIEIMTKGVEKWRLEDLEHHKEENNLIKKTINRIN